MFLNKLAKILCVIVPTQKIPFYRFLYVISRGSDASDEKVWPYSSSVTQYQHEMNFVFHFTHILILTVIFAILSAIMY